MTKKIISVSLCLIMVLTIFSIIPMSVSAQEIDVTDTEQYGDYIYNVLQDGTAEIRAYIGGDSYVTIPEVIDGYTVSVIGSSAFSGNEYLESVSIPSNIIKIDRGAFQYCYSLYSVTISDGVTEIGENAFYSCESLQFVEIPDSIIKIGYSAFEDTPWYYSFPDGPVYIGKVFMEYRGEMPENTTITLREDTISICAYAFGSDENLVCVNIGSNVEFLSDSYFYNSRGLKEINVSKDNKNYASKDGVLYDKDMLNLIFYPLGKSDENYSIPNTVTDIGNSSFRYNNSIKNVTIPSSVKCIENYAFYYCSNLESVTIEDGLEEIYGSVFHGCSKLNSINIPNTVTIISSDTFKYCTNLKSIDIPDSVEKVGSSLFEYSGLVNVTLGDSLKGISERMFSYCFSLENVKLGKNIKSIGANAFDNCYSLNGITIPDKVESIGRMAFNNASVYSVTLPACFTTLGESAFDTHYIEEINVAEDNKLFSSQDGVLYNKDKTVLLNYPDGRPDDSFRIPDSVITINKRAFSSCKCINEVIIGNSVTTIDSNAFAFCSSLESVIIPENVNIINGDAFWGCNELYSVTIPESVSSIGNQAFGFNDLYGGTPIEGFTIYGVKGSDAERYANEYEFTFIELQDHIDEDTNIEVDVAGDVTLNVAQVDKEDEKRVIEILGDNNELLMAYDISLSDGESSVQPESVATVRIPLPQGTGVNNLKVYRINDDGSKTDMNAYVKDGNIVFATNHFSIYAVAKEAKRYFGDADLDGEITIIDVTVIQRYLAQFDDKLTDTALLCCDADGNGKISILDCTQIQRYLAKLSCSDNVGKELTI